CVCACPVMIRRPESATAVSSAWPAKKMIDVSRMAKISARNGTAIMPNSTAATPDCCRTKRRARRTDLSPHTLVASLAHISLTLATTKLGRHSAATAPQADQYLKGVCEMLWRSPNKTAGRLTIHQPRDRPLPSRPPPQKGPALFVGLCRRVALGQAAAVGCLADDPVEILLGVARHD